MTTPRVRWPEAVAVHTRIPFCISCTGIAPWGVSINVFLARQMGHGRLYPLSWQKYFGGVSSGYLTTGGPHPSTHVKSVGQLVSPSPLHCLPTGLTQIFLLHKFPAAQSASALHRLPAFNLHSPFMIVCVGTHAGSVLGHAVPVPCIS